MTHIATNLYRYGSNSIVKLLKMKNEKNAGTFSHHFQSTFYGRYESLYHKRERKPTIKGKSNYVLESALPLKYMTIGASLFVYWQDLLRYFGTTIGAGNF